ncbi:MULTISPECIES: hypothetical protein [unclassified Streptomyces]
MPPTGIGLRVHRAPVTAVDAGHACRADPVSADLAPALVAARGRAPRS